MERKGYPARAGACRRSSLSILAAILSLCFLLPMATVPTAAAGEKVRVGYFPLEGYQQIDEDGRFSGYGYEYLQELARYTGWEYEYVTTDWKKCLNMLERGEIDLLGSVQRTPEREEIFAFPDQQSGLSSACLFTLEDDLRYAYQDYDSFDGMKVGLLIGNARNDQFDAFCQEKGFTVKKRFFYSEEALETGLKTGEVDAVLLASVRQMKSARVIAQFGASPFYFATTKGNDALLAQLTQALDELKSKDPYYDFHLYEKYYAPTYASVPAFTQEEQRFIQDCGPITTGLDPDRATLSRYDGASGTFVGIVPDVLALVSQRSGLTFEYTETDEVTQAGQALRMDQMQVVGPVMRSDGLREVEGMTLVTSGLQSKLYLLGGRDRRFDGNEAITIAVPTELFNDTAFLTEAFPNATIAELDTVEQCLDALRQEQVDLTLEDVLVARYRLQIPRNEDLDILPVYTFDQTMCLGVSDQADPRLVSVLEKTLMTLSSRELEDIISRNTTGALYEMTHWDIIYQFWLPLLLTGLLLLVVLGGVTVFQILRSRHYGRIRAANVRLEQALKEKESAAAQKRELEHRRMIDEEHQAELRRRIEYDDLTGLLSRNGFYAHTRRMLDAEMDTDFVIVRGDLNRFKVFNDLFGVETGDQLLSDIGAMMLEKIPKECLVGHLQADHFVACCPATWFNEERVMTFLARWFEKYPIEYRFTFNLGVYPIDERELEIGLMCDRAQLAIATVKSSYDSRCAYYGKELRARLLEEQEIISDMTVALEQGQFELYFQPQYNYADGNMAGAEALVRWNHPKHGVMSPGVFVPIFEKNGFITDMDNWVWEETCRCLSDWRDRFPELELLPISVNISRLDIYQSNLCHLFVDLMERYRLSPSLLRLEITESAYMENPEQLIGVVHQLQQAGFQVEMDDFGSGYSSLNTLKDVPVDVLKLDMRFLDTGDDPRGGSILSSMVSMARWLNLTVLAEGVENKQQADFLLSIGCRYMQGYYFSRPLDKKNFETVMHQRSYSPITHKTDTVSYLEMQKFWAPDSQMAKIFDSYVGAAAIMEHTPGCLEAVRINENYYRMVGVTREDYEPTRRNVLERLSAHDRRRLEEVICSATEPDQEVECEVHTISPGLYGQKDGTWLRMRMRLLARSGDQRLFYVLVEETTLRRALEDPFNALVGSVPGGIVLFELNEEGIELRIYNDTALEMFGFTREEQRTWSGRAALKLVDPQDMPLLEEQIQRLRAGEEKLDLVCRIHTKSGEVCWAHLSGTVMRREGGTAYVMAVIMDITAERVSMLTAQQQAQEMRDAYDAVSWGIVQFAADDAMKPLYINHAACRILGHDSPEEMLAAMADDIRSCVPQEELPIWLDICGRIVRGGGSQPFQHRAVRRDGTIISISGTGMLIVRPDGRKIIQNFFSETGVELDDQDEAELWRYVLMLKSMFGEIIVFDHRNGTVRTLFSIYHQQEQPGRAFEIEEGIRLWDTYIPDEKDRDALHRRIQESAGLAVGESISLLYRMMDRGAERWCRSIMLRLQDERVLCCNSDATDQVMAGRMWEELQSERKDRWRDRRYRILMELIQGISFDYESGSDTMRFYGAMDERGVQEHVFPHHLEECELPSDATVHPDDMEEYRAAFRLAAQGQQCGVLEFRARFFGGGYRWYRTRWTSVLPEGEEGRHVVGLIDDIQSERELHQKASYDAVTGLLNRSTTEEQIDHRLSDPRNRMNCVCAVLDVDNFKLVNDRHGHVHGDRVLRELGTLLGKNFRQADIVGRVGGDEFVVFLQGIRWEKALEVFNELEERCRQALSYLDPELKVSLSIGVCAVTDQDRTFSDVFSRADQALYRAKRWGKDRVEGYGPEPVAEQIAIEDAIR